MVRSNPDARLWLRTFEVPPRETSSGPPPVPNDVGPLRVKSAQLYRPNRFRALLTRPSIRMSNVSLSNSSLPDAT